MPRSARGRPRGRPKKRTRRDLDEPNPNELVLDSINVEPPDNSHEQSPTEETSPQDTPQKKSHQIRSDMTMGQGSASTVASPQSPSSPLATVTATATDAAAEQELPAPEPALTESRSHGTIEATTAETGQREQKSTASVAEKDITSEPVSPRATNETANMEAQQDVQESITKFSPGSEPSPARQGSAPLTGTPTKKTDISQGAQPEAAHDKEQSGSPRNPTAASEMDIDTVHGHESEVSTEQAASEDPVIGSGPQSAARPPLLETGPSAEMTRATDQEPQTKIEPESPMLTQPSTQQLTGSGDKEQTMAMPSAESVHMAETAAITEAKPIGTMQIPRETTTPSETPPGSAPTSSHRKYKPQFSAASDMILKRIKSKANAHANTGSNASTPTPVVSTEKAASPENVLKLPIPTMSMPVPTTMSMPMPKPRAMPMPIAQRPIAQSSFTNPEGLQRRLPPAARLPIQSNPPIQPLAFSQPLQPIAPHPGPRTLAPKTKIIIKPREKGQKRKRDPDDSDASQGSGDFSDADSPKSSATPTMTKSGRQVQKPTQYKPVHVTANVGNMSPSAVPRRKAQPLQPEPDQALCKICSRILSPQANQIVFCDGCNFGWHQLCHEPYIDAEYVSDESRSWFCRSCSAKRERHLARKKTLDGFKGTSWSHKSHDQRRSYLSRLSNTQMVNVLTYALEMHPDLPIFPMPASDSGGGSGGGGGLSSAIQPPAAFSRQHSSSIATPPAGSSSSSNNNNNSAKSHSVLLNGTTTTTSSSVKKDSSSVAAVVDAEDNIPLAWPKVGHGCLANLLATGAPREDDLQDRNDFEAFSVTTYDSTGKKTTENGMLV